MPSRLAQSWPAVCSVGLEFMQVVAWACAPLTRATQARHAASARRGMRGWAKSAVLYGAPVSPHIGIIVVSSGAPSSSEARWI